MSSLGFPFRFPHRSHGHGAPEPNPPSSPISIATAAFAIGVGSVLAVRLISTNPLDPSRSNPLTRPSPVWAALSLDDATLETLVEPKTGVEFPSVIDGDRRLLGVGVRRKSVFGLKNIDVYAFGIFVDDTDVKKLGQKYGPFSVSELKDNKDFYLGVLDDDIGITIRLQIVYGRLSIRSVRNAFEESIGARLQKFSQCDNKELLQRFTSMFRDEYKIPKGCNIDLSREKGHSLCVKIDGNEVGCIQSKLLCKSLFDLYIGEDPFDRKAKDDYCSNLASLLQV